MTNSLKKLLLSIKFVLFTKIRFRGVYRYYKGGNSEGDKMFVNCW